MFIGDRITKLRNNKNMTQEELADKLYVSNKTISSYESNRTEPNLEIISKLSEILDCSISYLIYGDTNKSDIECEVKIKLTEKEYKNLELLMKSNAKFIKESIQVDTYYEPFHRKFVGNGEITEWLRIGERGNKKIINYKNWYDVYCDEYEVEIDNSENLRKIFDVLGLKEIAVVDKLRKIYFYKDKYEISLDYVENLGYFIEIEVKKYTEDVLKEYDNLLILAKSFNLDLANIDKRGYPYYFLKN